MMDVAALLHLRVKRRLADSIYVDCPLCGDTRGKMNIHIRKNVFRCNYCGEHGGMLGLYAKARGISSSDAYYEIRDTLQTGNFPSGYGIQTVQTTTSVQNAEPASMETIHQTLSTLFSILSLSEAHRRNLRNRGLTDEQIEKLGYKSTPSYRLCPSLTERVTRQGCTVKGVPGFYLGKDGQWTVKFNTKTAGILIPVRGIDGWIRGAQIRLDTPIKDENGDADKDGAKYLWLSSRDKHMGVTSGSPVHFAGDPFARTVYVTEGSLKADIAHCLTNRSFVAVAGANNLGQLDPALSTLARNGTKIIVEAHDMDKYRNEMIDMGASRIHKTARKYGLEFRRLTWNPNYKGIDDWQLALRKKAMDKANDFVQGGDIEALLPAQRKRQRFRVYQLEFTDGNPTKPFAFAGVKALRKAGYEQPPAPEYRLMFDSEILCGAELPAEGVLQQIFSRYNDDLPDDYHGRSISPSDVVELYDEEQRRYFYRDTEAFVEVEFSSTLALPMAA
ncbi:MAG: DNA primase [Peptococcaceae bacterium]|nr:DNA primase [Peptococcaceae bacterium]